MFASASPAHGNRPFGKPAGKFSNRLIRRVIPGHGQGQDMEIAITDMADDRGSQAAGFNIAAGFFHTFGQP